MCGTTLVSRALGLETMSHVSVGTLENTWVHLGSLQERKSKKPT